MRLFHQSYSITEQRAFITPENDLHLMTGIVIKLLIILMMMINLRANIVLTTVQELV